MVDKRARLPVDNAEIKKKYGSDTENVRKAEACEIDEILNRFQDKRRIFFPLSEAVPRTFGLEIMFPALSRRT